MFTERQMTKVKNKNKSKPKCAIFTIDQVVNAFARTDIDGFRIVSLTYCVPCRQWLFSYENPNTTLSIVSTKSSLFYLLDLL